MNSTVKGFTVLVIILAAIGFVLLAIVCYMTFKKVYVRRRSIEGKILENDMAWRTKVQA